MKKNLVLPVHFNGARKVITSLIIVLMKAKFRCISLPSTTAYTPAQYSYKYPKAGEKNSVIEIHIYDTKTTKDIKADIGKETDIYIPDITWTNNNEQLSLSWMNRLQNDFRLLSASATTGKTSLIYEEKNKYYLDNKVDFLKDGKHFIMTSEKSSWQHIFLESINSKEEIEL